MVFQSKPGQRFSALNQSTLREFFVPRDMMWQQTPQGWVPAPQTGPLPTGPLAQPMMWQQYGPPQHMGPQLASSASGCWMATSGPGPHPAGVFGGAQLPGPTARPDPPASEPGTGSRGGVRNRSRSRSRSPGVQKFPDDSSKLSTAFKALGASARFGKQKVTPHKFRCSLITACDKTQWPMLLLSQFTCERLDMLLYILTGLLPTTKTSAFGVSTKGEARRAVREMYRARLVRNPSRLDTLSQDMDNIPEVAMRAGYPRWLCTPEMLRSIGGDKHDELPQPSVPTGKGPPPPPQPPQPVEKPAQPSPDVTVANVAQVLANAIGLSGHGGPSIDAKPGGPGVGEWIARANTSTETPRTGGVDLPPLKKFIRTKFTKVPPTLPVVPPTEHAGMSMEDEELFAELLGEDVSSGLQDDTSQSHDVTDQQRDEALQLANEAG